MGRINDQEDVKIPETHEGVLMSKDKNNKIFIERRIGGLNVDGSVRLKIIIQSCILSHQCRYLTDYMNQLLRNLQYKYSIF